MLEIFRDIEQGTEAWRRARAGIPTTSNFATVMASGRGGGESVTRRKYLYQLAGEIITGEPAESYSNGYMQRGKAMEAEARDYYAFRTNVDPEQIGFIRNGKKGCSPDSLIGENGMLEVKTHQPDILVDLIFKDQFPPEHKAQTQGALWVAEREWIDLICYFTGMPAFIKRAHRDSAYIRTVSQAVDQFNEELNSIVERIRAYGQNPKEIAA